MTYRFNKERHLHQILIGEDWKNLTGCTTILSVLAKPALIQWAANQAVDYIKESLCPGWDNTKSWKWLKETIEKTFEEARKAHTKRKEKSGDYGTKVHEGIELVILRAIQDNKGYIKKKEKSDEKSVQNFIDWAVSNKVKFLDTEKNVYSEKLFLGGIIDLVCEIDGKVWIGDIKTSKSGIYPENFAQIAGYQLMLQEMGLYPDIAGYIVINLKETGEILEKRSISNGDNTKFFLACLEIYRQQERLKNNITN